jgi:hypothetical protein
MCRSIPPQCRCSEEEADLKGLPWHAYWFTSERPSLSGVGSRWDNLASVWETPR